MTLFSDTRYVFVRYLTKLVRTPILLFFSLFQPILFLALFTQLLSNIANIPGILPPGVDSYLEFAAAGILLQNAFGSALQSGNSIVADIDSGFLQKMLVTPMSRPAILLGRLSSDAFRVVIQTAIILALAYVFGARNNSCVSIRFRCYRKQTFYCRHWSCRNSAHFLYNCLLWARVVRNFFSLGNENEKC